MSVTSSVLVTRTTTFGSARVQCSGKAAGGLTGVILPTSMVRTTARQLKEVSTGVASVSTR